MNVYLVTQNKVKGYDTYDSFVAIAGTKAEAKRLFPRVGSYIWVENKGWHLEVKGKLIKYEPEQWPNDLKDIKVTPIGEAMIGATEGVVCSSFNAG